MIKYIVLIGLLVFSAQAQMSQTDLEKNFKTIFKEQGIEDASIVVLGKTGKTFMSYSYGSASIGSAVAVDSASKLISTVTIMRLVQKGLLSLDDTIEKHLVDYKNKPQGKITLKQLLSFQSGYGGREICTMNPFITTETCAKKILKSKPEFEVGTTFDYNSTHLLIAAYLAEVVTKKKWQNIFEEQVAVPLKLSKAPTYYTFPKRKKGIKNPLIAGGLNISAQDYSLILLKLLAVDKDFLSENLVNEILTSPFTKDTVVKNSPMSDVVGATVPYALGNWVESKDKLAAVYNSSAGWRGTFPWVAKDKNYVAVVTLNTEQGAKKSYKAVLKFRPVLEKWLGE